MIDEEEYVDIVDENDKIIGKDTKENKMKKNLISRNVVVFVFDNEKNIFVVKRSPHKKTYPNRYDVSAVGNIKAGEDPKKAAERELKEELGVSCTLNFVGKVLNTFQHESDVLRYYSYIFFGFHNGDITLGSELTELQKIPLTNIENLVHTNKDKFVPSFIKEFNLVKEHLK